jgi:LysM repeat protein
VQAQEFKTHKVKVGETIESISKVYMVTPFDIYALNPDAKVKLEPNMVLIIPKSKVLENPVETKVTKLIGYTSHKVKRRETPYSIAKVYNITVEDLKKHNNHLYAQNLRRGERINIPKYGEISAVTNLGNTLRKYIVQPKEGKWRIAYQFGITIDELEKLNPKMADTLQVGQLINVPNIANNEEREVDEQYGYYTVVPREGFFALQRKLGLSQQEIEALNPEVIEGGLKVGMVLKVPRDVNNNEGSEDVQRSVLMDKISNLSTKKLAVMLPFRLNRVDFDSIQEVKDMLHDDGGLLNISLDFHTGVLMALDSAKQLGISTKLDVYDTKARGGEVEALIQRNDFRNYDAVIGPFITGNFDRAASILRSYDVPVVSPVSKPTNLYGNVFQTIPPDELMLKSMVNYVKQIDSIPARILIISDQKNRPVNNTLAAEFPMAKQIFSQVDEETGKDAFYITIQDIEEQFVEGWNLVFLETNNEGFASSVTSMLNAFNGVDEELEIERQVTLMTTNKNRAWESENVSNLSLSKLKFCYPSANKPQDENVSNSFVKAYERRFYTTPNRYAIRGFDLTMDVLLRLASEDDLYDASTNDIETEYVENKFRYSKKMFGGYYNESFYILKMEDLQITEVSQN